MGLIDTVEGFIWNIALKKGVTTGFQALAGLLAAKAGLLAHFGVTLDLSAFQAAGISAAAGLLEVLRNWLKQKYGLSFL